MVGLSVVTITKNSGNRIEDVVANVLAIADEAVVVDTGSMDRTRELARNAGARVVEFEGEFDYSSPRNLGNAAANGEWILHLDDDESIAISELPKIRNAMDAPYPVLSVPQTTLPINISAGYTQGHFTRLPRMLRKDGGYNFVGRVHEMIYPLGSGSSADFEIVNDVVRVDPTGDHVLHKPDFRGMLADQEIDESFEVLPLTDVGLAQVVSRIQQFRGLANYHSSFSAQKILEDVFYCVYQKPENFPLTVVYLAQTLGEVVGEDLLVKAANGLLDSNVNEDPVTLNKYAQITTGIDPDVSLELAKRSLDLHENSMAHVTRAGVHAYRGEVMSAEYYMKEAFKLTPNDPHISALETYIRRPSIGSMFMGLFEDLF